MDPYGADVVNVSLQLEGLRAAVGRLALAASKRDTAGETYLPLFEALNWAVSLDQRVQYLWRPEGRDRKLGEEWRMRVGGGERVTGIDWARNAVHHQWADALRLDPAGHGLYPSPTLFPSPELYLKPDHAWVWRDADDLPVTRERRKASKTKPAPADVRPMGDARPTRPTSKDARPRRRWLTSWPPSNSSASCWSRQVRCAPSRARPALPRPLSPNGCRRRGGRYRMA